MLGVMKVVHMATFLIKMVEMMLAGIKRQLLGLLAAGIEGLEYKS